MRHNLDIRVKFIRNLHVHKVMRHQLVKTDLNITLCRRTHAPGIGQNVIVPDKLPVEVLFCRRILRIRDDDRSRLLAAARLENIGGNCNGYITRFIRVLAGKGIVDLQTYTERRVAVRTDIQKIVIAVVYSIFRDPACSNALDVTAVSGTGIIFFAGIASARRAFLTVICLLIIRIDKQIVSDVQIFFDRIDRFFI